MQARYSRNIGTLTQEENDELKKLTVCVVGCGGLGGYIIEMLGRLGIGSLIAVDGDVFEESNLNRQILSKADLMGKSKALAAKERMKAVNAEVFVEAVQKRLTLENGKAIMKDADIVVDALDNIESRLVLESLCEELNIPLVHGAIGGWYGQVTTVLPGDKTLSRIYRNKGLTGIEKKLGNPSFTPALVASVEVSEVLKLIIKRGELLSKRLLLIDLLEQEYEIIPI
jgi:molybdopterin-synthase adenylyltransferase